MSDNKDRQGVALSDEVRQLLQEFVDSGLSTSRIQRARAILSRASSSQAPELFSPEQKQQMLKSAAEHGMYLGGQPVAYEFHNKETGHAIVDYSRHTYVGHLTAEAGYEARPLVYASSSRAEVESAAAQAAIDGMAERMLQLQALMKAGKAELPAMTEWQALNQLRNRIRAMLAAVEAPNKD